MDENAVFAAWRDEQDPIKRADLELELVRLLRKHAFSVIWLNLHQHIPELANWAVFLALHKSDTFKGECKFSTWFQYIVLNLIRNHIRGKVTKNEVGLDELSLGEFESIAVKPKDWVIYAPKLHQRDQVLLQHMADGLEFEDIGKLLDITPTAAAMRWTRLKRRLKRMEQEVSE